MISSSIRHLPYLDEQCNYINLLQEQNWYLNKYVAELAALESERIENKILILVTNTTLWL